MINRINGHKTNTNTKKNKKIFSNISNKIYYNRQNLIEKGIDWSCICLTKNLLNDLILNNFFKNNMLNKKEINVIQKSAKQAITNNKTLKSNNLELLYLNSDVYNKLKPQWQNNKLVKSVKEGNNAAFFARANKILMPEKELQLSIFHEIGHALNYNCSKLWQNVYKFSNISTFLTYLIFGKEVFNMPKTQKKSSSKKEALISTSPMIPNLIEEGVASIKGNHEAKKFVNKNLYKKIIKNNKLSFATYMLKFGFMYISFKFIFDIKNLLQKNI